MTLLVGTHATSDPVSPSPQDFGDFRLLSFHDVLLHRKMVEGSGAYAVFVRGGHAILGALGYEFGDRPRLESPVADCVHLYTGSSGEVRCRIREHAAGEARVSTLRRSLLAAETYCSAISATGLPLPDARNLEYRLDLWLAQNAWFVVWRTRDYLSVEASILATCASPFNVIGRKSDPFAKRLMGLRAAYDERPIRKGWAAAVAGII